MINLYTGGDQEQNHHQRSPPKLPQRGATTNINHRHQAAENTVSCHAHPHGRNTLLWYLIVARKSVHDILGFLVSSHQRGLAAACRRAPTVSPGARRHDHRWLPDCIRSPIASERLRGRLQRPVSFCEGNQHDPPRFSNPASGLFSLQVRPGSDHGLCTGRANRSGSPGNC